MVPRNCQNIEGRLIIVLLQKVDKTKTAFAKMNKSCVLSRIVPLLTMTNVPKNIVSGLIPLLPVIKQGAKSETQQHNECTAPD